MALEKIKLEDEPKKILDHVDAISIFFRCQIITIIIS